MGHVVVAGASEVDRGGLGPSITRNRAVVQTMNAGVRPKWIAFLDDDDEFLPDHLRKLVEHAEATDADVVYPWFELNVGGRVDNAKGDNRSEEHTSELQSLMRISYAVFCLKKTKHKSK